MEQLDGGSEMFADLHAAIEKGDLESVRRTLEGHAEEKFFLYNETSALYKAFQCKHLEMISFLIHNGAKFVGSEGEYLLDFGIDLDCLNSLLFRYNRRSEKSCVYRLMLLSQSPQVLDGERLNALAFMYEDFFRSNIIKSLMKVLELVDFDIVFDFESDRVNRIYRLNNEEDEIFSLTLPNAKEMFIGAKNLLSDDSEKKAQVYGYVAEQFCHLVMVTIFENNAKPYKEGDSRLVQEFRQIVLSVKSLVGGSSSIESAIRDIFKYYEQHSWESELIASVPRVMGIYGEDCGRKKLQKCPELARLLDFYEKEVLTKLKEYTESFANTKYNRKLREVSRNELISFKEKQISPLREDFPSFTEYAVVENGVSVISTNCTKLCALHVYHKLKPVYGDQLDRKILFFAGDAFERKRDEILKALKCKICEYLVLVLDDKELHHRRLLYEYLDEFQQIQNEGMNVIIISNSQLLGQEFEDKFLEYKWDDLTYEYKDFRTCPVEYIFKGERKDSYIRKENVSKLFSEEDIISLINGDLIKIQDSSHLYCQGYNSKTYIERLFQATIIDRKIFQQLPLDTSIFICGLNRWELKKLSVDESVVQWLEGPDDEIQKGKAIFISGSKRPMNFKHFIGKSPFNTVICLHYDGEVFYLINSVGDVCQQFKREARQTEDEMIYLLKSKKTLIISENAGCGKSTVMSSLIRHVKQMIRDLWILRVDLNKFSMNEEGPDSEESEFEDVFLMLGFRNGIEKLHFRNFGNQEKCFIFFDSFDQIPMRSKNSVLKLLSRVREKTAVKMVISTRRHHQNELEELLNTFSHQLVPFSREEQVRYLEKMWTWKLKYPNGEASQRDGKDVPEKIKNIIVELRKERTILRQEHQDLILKLEEIELEKSLDLLRSDLEKLNFTKLGDQVLERTSQGDEILEFLGVPLHLYMMGIIQLNGNFGVEIQSDIYGIYAYIIKQKIVMYVEEKGLLRDSLLKDQVLRIVEKDVFRLLLELADELLNERKVCFSSKMREEFELCSALELVTIEGREVRFVHRSMAEFFKAESMRLNLNKDVFMEILFDGKFKVVKRFLSDSLKKKNFENLSREFFMDADFLGIIMKRIVDVDFQFDLDCLKIVKRLLENFEVIVERDLVIKLIDQIDGLLKERFDGSPKAIGEDSHYIGGCLTVHILKVLLSRQFNFKTVVIHSLVRYSESPQEVIDVLQECISVASASAEIEKEETASRSLLELLSRKDSGGNGLLHHALRNQRVETFARLMLFFRNVLGDEPFIKETIQSYDYREQMEKFISELPLDRICGSFEALHSVFGDDEQILFNKHLKCKVIEKSLETDRAAGLDEMEESSITFETVICFFQKCLGIEKFKKFLNCRDCDNDCFIHNSLWRYSTPIINKCLNQIEKVLDDRNAMKQLLKSKDVDSRSVIHSAALRNMHLYDLLQLYDANLETDEIMETLVSADKDGVSAMQCIASKNSSGLFPDENEWLNQFLKRKGQNSRNILHFSSMRDADLGDSLIFCKDRLPQDEIRDMILSLDDYGNNVVHILVMKNSPETLEKNLNLIKEFFPNADNVEDISSPEICSFKTLLKEKSRDGKNICHFAAMNIKDFNFSILKPYLDATETMDLLRALDEQGQTCVHIAAYSLRNFCSLLDYADEMFKYDRSRYKKLIRRKSNCGNTIFHYMGQSYWGCNAFVYVNQIFDLVKEKLGSQKDYEDLLKVKNNSEETFLQTDCGIREEIIEFCNEILEKSLLDQLLPAESSEEKELGCSE